MILITYGVDKALYDNPSSIHNIMLTTTFYSTKTKKLVHLQHGKLFQNKLSDKLGSAAKIPSEQFMLEHENGSIEPLTRDEFKKKRKQFDPKRTVKEQEVWESYYYTDKRNQQEIVQIVISTMDGNMTAVIDFESVAQYKNFVPPAWLLHLSDDGTGLVAYGVEELLC